MLTDTHTQRVLGLASQKGLLRASDLDAIDAPRVVLTRLTVAGLLEKIGRGLYRLPESQGTVGFSQSAPILLARCADNLRDLLFLQPR